jgi:hypothetical protein
MQHEPTSQAAQDEERVEWAILESLVGEETSPWSEDEIASELNHIKRGDVTDGLARVSGVGVVHRCGGFAFLTRAARYTHKRTFYAG